MGILPLSMAMLFSDTVTRGKPFNCLTVLLSHTLNSPADANTYKQLIMIVWKPFSVDYSLCLALMGFRGANFFILNQILFKPVFSMKRNFLFRRIEMARKLFFLPILLKCSTCQDFQSTFSFRDVIFLNQA